MHNPPPSSRLGAALLTLIGAIVLLSAPAALAQVADTLQPWQVVTLESVSSSHLSPDGKMVAYRVSVPRKPMKDDSGPSWSELHVLDLETEGAEAVPFITGEVSISGVDWTPDGEISFLDKREGDEHRSLYVISTRGGEARKVVEHDTNIGSYSWAPDGKSLAFTATEKKSDEAEKASKKGFNQIIYEEDRPYTRLYLATLKDDEEAEVEEIEIEGAGTSASVRSVRFLPTGDGILTTVTPTPLIDDSYTRIKIRIVDLDGSTRKVFNNPGKLGKVLPSPDATHLAMISAADLNDPAAGRLMATGMEGLLRDLLPDFQGHVADFAWKDADTLVLIGDQGAETGIWEVDLDGSTREVIAPTTAIFTGVQTAADKLTLLGQSPQHPTELHLYEDGRLLRLTDSNPWLDNVRLARQEVVSYEARDGLEIEGVLIYPLDYRQGTRYPLIMVVHGGPESHYRNGWLTGYSQLGQYAASKGYAVFYPNYRGSTGRGVEFSKISQADAAGPEFDDYVDGVDHLIEIGLVDEDRVGITGGSYGGYASAWATTYYSDRFAAAIPFVGISNNISKVGTTDIPQEMYDVHHLKWLWDDWDYFAERSPIFYVKRNRTPTLILHGEDDPRVHPSQSLELHRHLKVLDQAPVRLVLYPGEGHGNRKSAARFDYLLRTMRWFDHYLADGNSRTKEPPPYTIDYAESLPWAATDDDKEDSEDSDDTEAEESP